MIKIFLQVVLIGIIGMGFASAATLTFATTFGPEVPGATGTGSGTFIWDTDAQTLFINVNWSGLSTSNPPDPGEGTTVAHIHCCTTNPGTGTVGVAVTPNTLPGFPTGTFAGTYSITLNLANASTFNPSFVTTFAGGNVANADDALLAGILSGRAYFNIHSQNFPAGEIRGFLSEVPEPGTMALLPAALGALMLLRRFKS